MPYEIPIVDSDELEVCRVVWDGELYQGEASVVAVPGSEDVATNVAGMIERRQDLKDVEYRSEGERAKVNGWKTYEGTVSALRVILPALGLTIGHIGSDMPPLGKTRSQEIEFNDEFGGIE